MDLATKTELKCGNSEMVIQENLPCSCLLLNGNDASLFPYLEASCLLGPGPRQGCWCSSSAWLRSRLGTVLGVGGAMETRGVWTTAAALAGGCHSGMEE